MKNKEDWKEIEENEKRINGNMVAKYGFNIEEYAKNNFSKENIIKRKKRKKLIKVFLVLLILALIISQFCSTSLKLKNDLKRRTLEYMETSYNEKIYITNEQSYWGGNGFYTMRMENFPYLEIHSVLEKEDATNDLSSRYYKYYFDKWEDKSKDKFIVKEYYEDGKYKNIIKKDWLYNFYTYIEVSNYNEFLTAIDDIIRFIEFMENRAIIIKSYIKINDKLIIPHGTRNENNEEIRQNAIRQY